MKYKIYLSKKARLHLDKLGDHLRRRIVKKLRFFVDSPNPLQYAKQLQDSKIAHYRFRVGDYRVLFDVNKKDKLTILMILHVKHRKEVYKLF